MPHPCHVFNSENFPDSFQQQSQQTSQRAQFGRDMQGPTNDSSDSAGSQDSNTDNNSPDSQQSGNAQSDAPSAGKTTMLLLISGLANPTEGKVLCNGSDLSQQDRHPSPCPVFDMS